MPSSSCPMCWRSSLWVKFPCAMALAWATTACNGRQIWRVRNQVITPMNSSRAPMLTVAKVVTMLTLPSRLPRFSCTKPRFTSTRALTPCSSSV
ncbi:hypothetical protein D3C81_2092210 [compost metagenome]